MKHVVNPKVKLLAEGEIFVAKEMAARAGEMLPKHRASKESVLIIQEGACILHLEDADLNLQIGEVYVVAADLIHQIEALEDFKAVHVMPKDIKFEFFR